jgi:hypothetical protein
MFNRKLSRYVAAVAAAVAIGGATYGIADATSGGGSSASSASSAAPGSGPGSGSNARSGPAAGGAVGTVASVSGSGFTLTTTAGQKVTIDKAPGTTYQKGTSSGSAGVVTSGESVLVLGTVDNTTITAAKVIVEPDGGGSAPSSAAQVVPFQRGAQSVSKQVGHIPTSYQEGSGTIVSGTAADQATEAALTAYPGGIVDRVVQLSNGEYEVHNIGVNWPHHMFVSQTFTVVGAS